jgi:hypothetical protein
VLYQATAPAAARSWPNSHITALSRLKYLPLARSRPCHRVKQSKGWSVTQPRPGWHQWTTPSGRTYTQVPVKYPA